MKARFKKARSLRHDLRKRSHTWSQQSNISSPHLSLRGGPCVTIELHLMIDWEEVKCLLRTSDTVTLQRGVQPWPAARANPDPVITSFVGSLRVLSLSLLPPSLFPRPLFILSGLSGAHRRQDAGPYRWDWTGGLERGTRQRCRGEWARAQSIEKLSERERGLEGESWR